MNPTENTSGPGVMHAAGNRKGSSSAAQPGIPVALTQGPLPHASQAPRALAPPQGMPPGILPSHPDHQVAVSSRDTAVFVPPQNKGNADRGRDRVELYNRGGPGARGIPYGRMVFDHVPAEC